MNNETIVREFLQHVWNRQHIESIPQFVAEAYTIQLDTGDPWEGKTINHVEFIVRLNYTFQSFPDIHFEITSAIADGNLVAVNWIMTGTNTGKIGDYPPTNKSIKANGVTFYQLHEGKITGHTQVFDRTTIMRQLGFIQ